jgi:hypothetical protein
MGIVLGKITSRIRVERNLAKILKQELFSPLAAVRRVPLIMIRVCIYVRSSHVLYHCIGLYLDSSLVFPDLKYLLI